MPKGIYLHKKRFTDEELRIKHCIRNRKRAKDNPERGRNQLRNWRKNNPDKARQMEKSYRENNLEAYRQRKRNYARLHPEIFRSASRKRRVIKLKAEGDHTFGDWELLKKQYGYVCPSCHKSEPEIKLTEDHIVPLTKGGSDFIENIQPLCKPCNSIKHTKIMKFELQMGTPASSPVTAGMGGSGAGQGLLTQNR